MHGWLKSKRISPGCGQQMSGKPRIPALLLQNPMLRPPSTHKLSAKRSFLKTQECQRSPSLHLFETLSPTKLGQGHSELYNPGIWETKGRSRPVQAKSHLSCSTQPFLALEKRKQEMPSLRSSPHCPALLSQFLPVRPPTFPTLPLSHPPLSHSPLSHPPPFPPSPQSNSILIGLHIHTVPSEIAGNCWGPACLEPLKQGASTFKRIKL